MGEFLRELAMVGEPIVPDDIAQLHEIADWFDRYEKVVREAPDA